MSKKLGVGKGNKKHKKSSENRCLWTKKKYKEPSRPQMRSWACGWASWG